MEDIFLQIATPLTAGVLGWLTSAYRNKQKRENDIIDNIQRILDIQDKKITEQDKRIGAIESENRQFRWIIRQAYGCKTANNDCPVLSEQYRIDKKQNEKTGNDDNKQQR